MAIIGALLGAAASLAASGRKKSNTSIIDQAKRDWDDAYRRGDKAGMDRAHAAAEAERAKSGYSGGTDGSKYIPLGGNTGSTSSGGSRSSGNTSKAPSYTKIPDVLGSLGGLGSAGGNNVNYGGFDRDLDYSLKIPELFYNGATSDVLQKYMNERLAKMQDPEFSKYGADNEKSAELYSLIQQRRAEEEFERYSEERANYESPFAEDMEELFSELRNREDFSYNPEEDELYGIYADEYARLGDQAMQDTLAEYASMTGGMPSSWALSAAQQAKNSYNQQLQNIIPALMDAAYNRYQNDFDSSYRLLSTLYDLDASDYNRFVDQLNSGMTMQQYLAEASNNRYNSLVLSRQAAEEQAAKRKQQEFENSLSQAELEEAKRKAQANEALGFGNLNLSKDQFNYQKEKDAKNSNYNAAAFAADRARVVNGELTLEELVPDADEIIKNYGVEAYNELIDLARKYKDTV